MSYASCTNDSYYNGFTNNFKKVLCKTRISADYTTIKIYNHLYINYRNEKGSYLFDNIKYYRSKIMKYKLFLSLDFGNTFTVTHIQ